ELALEPLAVELDVQLALPDRLGGWGLAVLVPRPGAGVPDDDVAAAVLPGRDDALEVEVLHRVVLDVDREAPGGGVEGGPLGHRPAGQDAVDLEPEVVVEPGRPVPLDDEDRLAVGVGAQPVRVAGGLGGAGEVPHPLVAGQRLLVPVPGMPAARHGAHRATARGPVHASRAVSVSSRGTGTAPARRRRPSRTGAAPYGAGPSVRGPGPARSRCRGRRRSPGCASSPSAPGSPRPLGGARSGRRARPKTRGTPGRPTAARSAARSAGRRSRTGR